MGFVRQAFKSACKIMLPRRVFLAQGPLRSSGGCHEIALTFDDGPDPDTTPALLELLERWRIPATFFVIGEKVERHRDIVHQIVAAGHALGNHSYSHSEPHETSTGRFLDEIRRTQDLLEEISNRSCTLVRPPKGALSPGKQLGLWRQGMTIALWNIDPRDYRMQSPQQAAAWGKGYTPRGGDIVLLHDNHPWAAHIVQAVVDNSDLVGEIRYVRLSDWI